MIHSCGMASYAASFLRVSRSRRSSYLARLLSDSGRRLQRTAESASYAPSSGSGVRFSRSGAQSFTSSLFAKSLTLGASRRQLREMRMSSVSSFVVQTRVGFESLLGPVKQPHYSEEDVRRTCHARLG